VGFSDVIGLNEAKRSLNEAIVMPTLYPHLFSGALALVSFSFYYMEYLLFYMMYYAALKHFNFMNVALALQLLVTIYCSVQFIFFVCLNLRIKTHITWFTGSRRKFIRAWANCSTSASKIENYLSLMVCSNKFLPPVFVYFE